MQCRKYTVVAGDTCAAIQRKFRISFRDFERLNPQVNDACTNLIAGQEYSVSSSCGPPAPRRSKQS